MAKHTGSGDGSTADDGAAQRPGGAGYKILATLGAIAATAATRKALAAAWQAVTGRQPPENPEHPDLKWGEAATWAAASAVVVALGKLAAQRRIAATWRRASGELPPGLDQPPQ
jgi:hypothetical protein